jgi:hypothetical protein
MSRVQEISEAIEHLNVRDQMRPLHDLPAHLKIQPDDIGWLKATEPTFDFWNSPEGGCHLRSTLICELTLKAFAS